MKQTKNQLKSNDLIVDKAKEPEALEVPFFLSKVEAGFPGPTTDNYDGTLDLNRYLIHNPPATFFVRATGDSMIGAGIFSDDILIVDRSIEAKDGKIVIAVINGEMTVKRLKIYQNHQKIVLHPENPKYPHFVITTEMDFSIWGVVTAVIHKV
jgi:DNA polymerase V